MGVLPLPREYRWRDLRPPATLELAPARRAVTALLHDATVATVDRDAVEAAIERALVGGYGLWAVGWRWAASEAASGGPIAAWCCADHSILPEDDPDPDPTATSARVVAALDEWWRLLGELAGRFAALAAAAVGLSPAAGVERAAAALLALAVERTRAEDGWPGTFAAFLTWYLEVIGHDPDRGRAIVDATIAGRLDSAGAPDAATVAATCAALGHALTDPDPPSAIDGLAAWEAIRSRRLLPAPIGSTRVAVVGDGHQRYIDDLDHARDPARAARMRAALAACRLAATQGEALTVDRLAAWQAIVLGEPARFRTTAADPAARFAAALAEAGVTTVPTAIRAARVYLDVGFFQPFVDGNGRAARLALDYVVTRSGLALHLAAPLFLRARDPGDVRAVWWFTYLIDRLVGRPG